MKFVNMITLLVTNTQFTYIPYLSCLPVLHAFHCLSSMRRKGESNLAGYMHITQTAPSSNQGKILFY